MDVYGCRVVYCDGGNYGRFGGVEVVVVLAAAAAAARVGRGE